MSQILFKNANLLDPRWGEARGGYEVLVEGALIKGIAIDDDQVRPGPGARVAAAKIARQAQGRLYVP